MDEFLQFVGPELAAFLRVLADYVDEPSSEPDPEEQPATRMVPPTPKFMVNERGGFVPIDDVASIG